MRMTRADLVAARTGVPSRADGRNVHLYIFIVSPILDPFSCFLLLQPVDYSPLQSHFALSLLPNWLGCLRSLHLIFYWCAFLTFTTHHPQIQLSAKFILKTTLYILQQLGLFHFITFDSSSPVFVFGIPLSIYLLSVIFTTEYNDQTTTVYHGHYVSNYDEHLDAHGNRPTHDPSLRLPRPP